MKKVEIKGVAKVNATFSSKNDYSSLEINGMELDRILAEKMVEVQESDNVSYPSETALCRVTISIEPYVETLSVNGQEVALEL